jgi:predicted ribosomally synthesized peptide with nif11-like leader
MSRVELERFVADVKADPRLQAELKERGSGLASVVEIARSRGYEITTDDVRDYVRAPTPGIYAIFEDFFHCPRARNTTAEDRVVKPGERRCLRHLQSFELAHHRALRAGLASAPA